MLHINKIDGGRQPAYRPSHVIGRGCTSTISILSILSIINIISIISIIGILSILSIISNVMHGDLEHTGIWNTRGFGTRDQPKPTPTIFLNNTLQQRIYQPTNSHYLIVLSMQKAINKAIAIKETALAY